LKIYTFNLYEFKRNASYEICISHNNFNHLYLFKINSYQNKTFAEFKTENLNEFKILIAEYKYYYLGFQGTILNNEDKVLPFLNYLNEHNYPMNFTLMRIRSSNILKEPNQIAKNNIEQNRKFEIKKEVKLEVNLYFSEISYLEANLKTRKLIEEDRQYKQGKGTLFNNLQKISEKFKKEKLKKAEEFKIRNENFFDPEDKYFNVKEFCFEIKKLNWEEKKKKEEIIRKGKKKKDNPMLITYNDVFKYRLKETIYFYLYFICILVFMVNHRYSNFEDKIEYNIRDYFEKIFFKNSIYKNFLLSKQNNKFSSDFTLNDQRYWAIYQTFIINNILVNVDFYKDIRELYNSILLTDDKNHPIANYNGYKTAQFSLKFAKRHLFKNNDSGKKVDDYTCGKDKNCKNSNFLRDFLDKNIVINDKDYEEYINNFLYGDINLDKGFSLDLSYDNLDRDYKEKNSPININIDNFFFEENLYAEFIKNFLDNKLLNNFDDSLNFDYDKVNHTIKMFFHEIIDEKQIESKTKGKIREYTKTGYKIYYNISQHNEDIYDKFSNYFLRGFDSSEDLKFTNIDFTFKHNKFNLPLRILINFELSNIGYVNFDYDIIVLDFVKSNFLKVCL